MATIDKILKLDTESHDKEWPEDRYLKKYPDQQGSILGYIGLVFGSESLDKFRADLLKALKENKRIVFKLTPGLLDGWTDYTIE